MTYLAFVFELALEALLSDYESDKYPSLRSVYAF